MPAPPPVVYLDTIEPATSIETDYSGTTPRHRYIRSGFLEGIDVSDTMNKSEALWIAKEAIEAAAIASALESPARDDVLISRIFLEPRSDTTAAARIMYETPQFESGPPSTYLIRDGGQKRTFQTNRMPGSHEPLVCTFIGITPASGSEVGSGEPYVITDRITYTIVAPLREILISALVYGRPTNGAQDQITTVNHATWPTGAYPGGTAGLNPKPVGFWMLDKYQTDYARYSGYYTIEAAAITKVKEDWSETGTLINRQTNRYIKVDPDDLAALLSPGYTHTVTNGNGVQRVGFYETVNFVTLFGF